MKCHNENYCLYNEYIFSSQPRLSAHVCRCVQFLDNGEDSQCLLNPSHEIIESIHIIKEFRNSKVMRTKKRGCWGFPRKSRNTVYRWSQKSGHNMRPGLYLTHNSSHILKGVCQGQGSRANPCITRVIKCCIGKWQSYFINFIFFSEISSNPFLI